MRVSGAASEPLGRIKVELYHRDGMGPNNYIDSTYTDNNGNYSFSKGFPWIFSYHTFIRVYAEGETFRVARSWYSSITPLLQYYVVAPDHFGASENERHNITIPFQNNDLFKAFSVSQGMAWGERYAIDVGGMNTNKFMKVAYPTDTTSFCWNTFSGIGSGNFDSLNTLLHEYGHFVTGAMGDEPTKWRAV